LIESRRRCSCRIIWANYSIIIGLLAVCLVACGASGKTDPWQNYVDKELARLEELGEPESFYAVYEGNFGGADLRMATWLAGDELFRIDSDMGIISISMGYDGKNAWIQMKGAPPRELSSAEEDELFSGMYFDSTEYLTDEDLNVEVLGRENWDGVRVWEVALTSPQGYKRDLFIRDGDWELAGYRSYGTSTMLLKIKDIEMHGAISVPKHLTMQLSDLEIVIEFTLVEAEVDCEVDPSIFLPPRGKLSPLILSEGETGAVIDMQVDASRMILVPGSAGSLEGLFLLDTGASSSILDETVAASLNLTENSGFAAVGVGGAAGARIVRTSDAVSIGEGGLVTLPSEVSYIAMDLGPIMKGLGTELLGIIGQDLMARATVEIDLQTARLVITPYSEGELEGSGENPLAALLGMESGKDSLEPNEYEIDRIAELITVEGSFANGEETRFIVDTGFGGEIGILSSAVERLGLKTASAGGGEVVSGVGGVSRIKARVEKLKVSVLGRDAEFENVPVISGPIASMVGGGADGLVGIRFFEGMRVEFDYLEGIVRVLSDDS